ncbi:hypothetical protein [Nonomuraea basaltis]|uniref:hypothetical protein n=1 Tax=Nonomuraea basaltis TaxID=2495887 RepID=UPI00110C46C6|nr:hypothetical protein [Nonomuraea basaltis]TMR95102.1 hypothetical protein EJK15_30285 [Nonomuraea basaltis]
MSKTIPAIVARTVDPQMEMIFVPSKVVRDIGYQLEPDELIVDPSLHRKPAAGLSAPGQAAGVPAKAREWARDELFPKRSGTSSSAKGKRRKVALGDCGPRLRHQLPAQAQLLTELILKGVPGSSRAG